MVEVDMEVEVLVEVAMEVVEKELEDMLITERMIWGKTSRKFTSTKQKQIKMLNPNHLMILSF